MNAVVRAALALLCLLVPTALTGAWVGGARARLSEAEAAREAGTGDVPQVAVASASDVGYCTADLKKVLRRVLQSCGLLGSGEVRGCQPLEAKSVATMAGGDFNALFQPLSGRASILQFDQDSDELDVDDQQVLDETFADQRGASYFFVVSRASPEGSAVYNRDLSQRRGKAVLEHLRTKFSDPDLDKEVGLLWLGEEFAQLDAEFCTWKRSGPTEACESKDLNRSAFVAWIDCTL